MNKKLAIILLICALMFSGCTNTYLNKDEQTGDELASDFEIEITSDSAMEAEIDSSVWYLTLVNFEYALPDDFSVELAEIAPNISVDARIVDAYNQMYEAAKADGITLNPCSGYRSVEYQKGLFTRRVKEYMIYGYNQVDAEKIVATYTARPGRSEHNLGLAIDFYDATTALTEDFETTAQGKWLRENSYKYGFIMRYSSDKTSITAITYEPWHFRYVGVEDATKIYESGKCLEEYLGKVGYYDIDISGLTTTAKSTTTTSQTKSAATSKSTQKPTQSSTRNTTVTAQSQTTSNQITKTTTTTTTTKSTTKSTTVTTTTTTTKPKSIVSSSVRTVKSTTTAQKATMPSFSITTPKAITGTQAQAGE